MSCHGDRCRDICRVQRHTVPSDEFLCSLTVLNTRRLYCELPAHITVIATMSSISIITVCVTA